MADAIDRNDTRWLRPALVARWREIILVLLAATGLFIASSAWGATHGSSHRYFSLILTNSRMLVNLALESAILGLFLIYLHRRGWTPADLRIKPGVVATLEGIPLMIAMFLVNLTIVFGLIIAGFFVQSRYQSFTEFIMSNAPQLAPHSIQIGWVVLITAVVFNAFFEEITCTSYMFNQFAAKRGPLFALLLTVVVRMGYHTYEGPTHMLGIGAVFFVAGACYWWTRNVWPLIVAHALVDLASMALLKMHYG
jgi:membrane protease YdiL (CAAX protease family)